MFKSSEELEAFRHAVLTHVVTEGVDVFISQVLEVHSADVSGVTPKQRLECAINFVVAKGFFYQPPLVENLLSQLEARGMDCSVLRQRLLEAQPVIFHVEDHAWNTPLLPGDEPFFDREEARRGLEELLKPEPLFNPALPFGRKPPRVLAVVHPREPGRQGRTQLYRYLRYRVSLQPWEHGLGLAYINFREHQTLRPEKFLRVLASELGTTEDIPEQGASHEADWHRQVIEWLMQVCLSSHKWWYFVFDNFDDPNVPNQTLALIDFLTWYLTLEPEDRPFRVGTPLCNHQPPMRLVLLGYDTQRFQTLNREHRVGNRLCQLSLPAIESQHLASCFEAILTLRQIPASQAKAQAQHVAAQVMKAVDAASPPEDQRLPLLNKATRHALLQLGWCSC